jgi:hypothetical protein
MLHFCTTNFVCLEKLFPFFIKDIAKELSEIYKIVKGICPLLKPLPGNVVGLLRSDLVFRWIYSFAFVCSYLPVILFACVGYSKMWI